MSKVNSARLKHMGWGAAIGAVIVMIIGFTWGGWVTASTAKEQSEQAVVASRAAICVGQFMKGPDFEAQLKAFGATESWKRREFIEKGGWDKLPWEETARGYISGACADGIEVLLKK